MLDQPDAAKAMDASPASPPAGWIFDCDGVLVDSEPLALGVMRGELERLGLVLEADEIHARFTGRTLSDCADIISGLLKGAPMTGFAERFEQRLAEVFAHSLEAVDGIGEVLEVLKRAGRPIAVASSGSRAKISRSLALTGLDAFFPPEQIFSAADVRRGKPAPDLFLHAAAGLGLPPSRCVVIEDSTPGLAAAVAAGARVVALQRPGSPAARVPEGIRVIAHPRELLGLVFAISG